MGLCHGPGSPGGPVTLFSHCNTEQVQVGPEDLHSNNFLGEVHAVDLGTQLESPRIRQEEQRINCLVVEVDGRQVALSLNSFKSAGESIK